PDICPQCGQTCSTLPTDDDIPDEVRQFLVGNPAELFSQAIEIYRFQDNHNRLYASYLTEQLKLQKDRYEREIQQLKQEMERLKRGSTSSLPTPTRFQPFGTLKRPDFMSRFKTTVSATNLTVPQTPASSLREQVIRPGTPSFMERTVEKKPLNPFSKGVDGLSTPTTPNISRRGLDIPGSITRHPQLTKTPSRSSGDKTPSLPFQLLRPPKTA
ncbi:hypothetical protein WA588_006058, partial [Blastocystis sp. NMH]